MDEFNSHNAGGSLQISTEVIEKIARHAAQEVEGVHEIAPSVSAARTILGRMTLAKPVRVELKNDVADIEVSLVVKYGTKIPELSEQVQRNVKEAVQSMTSISVAKVDVTVIGVETVPGT